MVAPVLDSFPGAGSYASRCHNIVLGITKDMGSSDANPAAIDAVIKGRRFDELKFEFRPTLSTEVSVLYPSSDFTHHYASNQGTSWINWGSKLVLMIENQ